MILLAAVILAHSWYPTDCCAGDDASGDCHPIPCEQITERGDAYQWRDMLFKGAMVRISKDAGCHVCHGTKDGAPAYPHCIFLLELS